MKNIFTYVFLPLFWCGVHAQNDYSAASRVDLVLKEVTTITVNHQSVDLAMNQGVHFLEGNASELLQNHVQVTATSGYRITVETDEEHFRLNGSATDLAVENAQLEVSRGENFSDSPGNATNFNFSTGLQLQNTAATILTSPAGSFSQGFHVQYRIPAGVTGEFINKQAGNYSATVRYTLLPD